MKAYQGTVTSGVWTAQNTQTFASAYQYDFNGNITELERYAGGNQIDDLEYFYNHDNHIAKTGLVSNKLYLVDEQSTHTGGNDLKQGTLTGTGFDPNDDATWNYDYDPIGNLVQDVNEGIDQILWTVTGKVSDVIFEVDLPNNSYNLAFRYDPMGNRIAKIKKPHNSLANCTTWTVTWYSRDAQGNVMAVYNKPQGSLVFSATEFNIYGSSRIGMVTQPEELDEAPTIPVAFSQTLGNRVYEFSNHLGNVLTTFSDRKIATEGNPGLVAYYSAEILSSTDYYPFGFQMPGRVYEGDYRYGFNGKEQDPETYGTGNIYDYGFRIFNPRIGKFLSVDPLYKDFPMLTTFQYASNNPILNIDLDGLEGTPVTFDPQNGVKPVVINTQNDQMVAANNAARQAAVSATFITPPKPYNPGSISPTPGPIETIRETMSPELYNMYRFDIVMSSVSIGGLATVAVTASTVAAPYVAQTITSAGASTILAAPKVVESAYCAYHAMPVSLQSVLSFSAGVVANEFNLHPELTIPTNGYTQAAFVAGQLGDYLLKQWNSTSTAASSSTASQLNTGQGTPISPTQQATPPKPSPTPTQQASSNTTSSSQSSPASKATTSQSSTSQTTGYQWAPATQSSSPQAPVSPKGYTTTGM